MKRVALFAVLVLSAVGAAAQEEAPRKNWFNDPFFQVRDGMPACPEPRGPLLTDAEMKAESHGRIERGTSCWMAGQCAQPNAYLYDAGIAEAIRQRFAQNEAYRDASLWISVKRRFVWVEGCVRDAKEAGALEEMVRSLPDVERVFVDVMAGTIGKPPYPLLHAK
jgi:hypothetical protein